VHRNLSLHAPWGLTLGPMGLGMSDIENFAISHIPCQAPWAVGFSTSCFFFS
jgi:hypothetical protein